MKNIEIVELSQHMEFYETIVNWLYQEWGSNNLLYWKHWIKSSTCSDDIPKTYILTLNGEPAGTYSLWRCDLQSCQDLFPWFGGLYVAKKFRGQTFNNSKLGEIMQRHALKELKMMGYKKVFLFTEKNVTYYIRNGWKYLYDVPDEKDNIVKICKYELEG